MRIIVIITVLRLKAFTANIIDNELDSDVSTFSIVILFTDKVGLKKSQMSFLSTKHNNSVLLLTL